MVKIIKNTEFTARAMQAPDFKNKVQGYNFSYPVLNTIEICNLFISGGIIEINIERMGKSKWAYDLNATALSVESKGIKNVYHICNAEELGTAMMQYYEANSSVLFERNCEISLKKSKAKIGNQNAKKEKTALTTENQPIKAIQPSDNTDYPIDFMNNIPLINQAVENNNTEYCELDEYIQKTGKSIGEYFYWLMGKGWLWKTSYKTQLKIKDTGYDIDLAARRERTIYENRENKHFSSI